MGALRNIIEQDETASSAAEEMEDKFRLDPIYREPVSIQISDDWDSMMDEYMDDFQDFGDLDSF